MFYYLIEPLLSFHFVLIAAAVIPALLLLIKVYRSDRLEKESSGLLLNLVKAGVLSSLLALVEERVLSVLLGLMVSPEDPVYNVILYFGIVAFSEESSKYLFLRHHTWRSPEFDCQYDQQTRDYTDNGSARSVHGIASGSHTDKPGEHTV